MKKESLNAWKKFFSTFRTEVEELGWEVLERAWSSDTERTEYYLSLILPRMASNLKLRSTREQYSVDYVMFTDSGVPWAFVQTENDIANTYDEVCKLCCFTAPVRVLITVSEWNSSLGGWTHPGYRSFYLPAWQELVEKYNKVWPRVGVLSVIVGERGRDGIIRFYSYVFNTDGKLAQKAEPAFALGS